MDWAWPVLAALGAGLAAAVGLLARLLGRLKALEAARAQPDQALLLLQRGIEGARQEGRERQAETLASVREELRAFAGQMTAQVGQAAGGVRLELQHVGRVVGEVQGSLGRLGEATQRVFEVGRDIAGLEQVLRSPKVRGGFGELMLESLLAQLLPREHWELQHAFATGDRVDAVVRVGDRLVPVDAKFPLEGFRRMLEEPDEERRRPVRRAFARDVKARVDEIAKRYIRPDEGTFDFALMYVPAEHVYYEIVARDRVDDDEAPAAYALSRRVIPVSPNSLYAYLQVIVLGLRGLAIERDAREIQARLGGLRADVERFREAFDVLGRHLGNARNKHDEAAAALARVEGKLLGMEARGQASLPGVD
jgi:DNA recombination protein RmuC